RPPDRGETMTEYLIYFNQQWVGDHSAEWFASRAPLAHAVVQDMKDAGVLVFGGGLEEDIDTAVSVDTTSGTPVFTDGPYTEAAGVAEACGWPQTVRRFQPGSLRG